MRAALLVLGLAVLAQGAIAVGSDPGAERWKQVNEARVLVHAARVGASAVEQARVRLRPVAVDLSDEAGLAAGYLLGRIAQLHAPRPDLAEAAAWYSRVWTEGGPQSRWGRRGAVQNAILRLTEPGLSPAAQQARLDEVAALATALAGHPEAAVLHQLRALTLFRTGASETQRIEAVEAGLAAGGLTNAEPQANLLMEAAWLAREQGDLETMAARLTMFLAEFPGDSRTQLVRDLLAEASKVKP